MVTSLYVLEKSLVVTRPALSGCRFALEKVPEANELGKGPDGVKWPPGRACSFGFIYPT
jgi:hypothetical protein